MVLSSCECSCYPDGVSWIHGLHDICTGVLLRRHPDRQAEKDDCRCDDLLSFSHRCFPSCECHLAEHDRSGKGQGCRLDVAHGYGRSSRRRCREQQVSTLGVSCTVQRRHRCEEPILCIPYSTKPAGFGRHQHVHSFGGNHIPNRQEWVG